jgi:hypothetical protein
VSLYRSRTRTFDTTEILGRVFSEGVLGPTFQSGRQPVVHLGTLAVYCTSTLIFLSDNLRLLEGFGRHA